MGGQSNNPPHQRYKECAALQSASSTGWSSPADHESARHSRETRVDSPNGPLGTRPSATGTSRILSLDGLRAIGLLLIVGFHFGIGGLPGGYFGVDVFFVLSGFLITGLLLGEHRRRGSIQLGSFWIRRARRLLPALVVMVAAVAIAVRVLVPYGTYADFRSSALSALFYVSNWWQIGASHNYFVTTGPVSPLTHTWSLAVEEQFYLVWPLVVIAVLFIGRTAERGLRLLLAVSAFGAIASSIEMATLYSPTANTTRLYFGTDTHAQSILVGAALACVLALVQRSQGGSGIAPHARSRVIRRLLAGAGALGLLSVVVLSVTEPGTASFDFNGGFLLASISAAAIIASVVCVPDGTLGRSLSVRPLVWIGSISYGAYLWHFPVAVFLDQERTGLRGVGLFAARVGCTLVLASASFYLLERPILEGTFWRSAKAIPWALAGVAATASLVLVGSIAPAAPAVHVAAYSPRSVQRPPPTLLVLGDSTAYILGYALQATAPPGTTVINGGIVGCGLTIATRISVDPPAPGLAMFRACNPATPPAARWPALDATKVAATRPGDTVLLLAGAWEVYDTELDGRWLNITDRPYQRYLLDQLRLAVRVATSHGAHLELATLPPFRQGTYAPPQPFPQGDPIRRQIYNHLLTVVAAENPRSVSILDYAKILCPTGRFVQTIGAVEIRTDDGLHTPAYVPGNVFADNAPEPVAHRFYNWVAPRIWPAIIEASSSRR